MARPAERKVTLRDGREVGVNEAARELGISRHTLQARWTRGIREPDLLRKNLRTWEVGLSVDDWYYIMEYARERGSEAAMRKFGVPTGAIRAVLNDQWERVT